MGGSLAGHHGGAAGSADVPDTGEFVTVDVTSLVREWVSDPSSNRGLYLAALGDSSTETHFASCEDPVPNQRPRRV